MSTNAFAAQPIEHDGGETPETTHFVEPRCRVNLTRGQRGSYGWDITLRGDDSDAVLSELKAIDDRLRLEYGS